MERTPLNRIVLPHGNVSWTSPFQAHWGQNINQEKTTMKKLIIASALTLAFTGGAFAQAAGQATVTGGSTTSGMIAPDTTITGSITPQVQAEFDAMGDDAKGFYMEDGTSWRTAGEIRSHFESLSAERQASIRAACANEPGGSAAAGGSAQAGNTGAGFCASIQ